MNEKSPPLLPEDLLYFQARNVVLKQRRASVALVQRHLHLGYGVACALFERMEKEGIVVPVHGSSRLWILNDENFSHRSRLLESQIMR